MNSLQLQTDGGQTHFQPGSRLSGKVSWQLEAPPTAIELELVWNTQGKGSTDTQIVDSMRFETPPAEAERTFSFELPASPYSFSGKLVSLVWSLRVTAYPSRDWAELALTVSPQLGEIDLYGDSSISPETRPKNSK